MAKQIVLGNLRIAQWVTERIGMPLAIDMQCVGLEQDGELIAGVIFNTFTGPAIWAHVAAVPGRHWLTRDFLRAAFAYPFLQLGVDQVLGWVESTNTEARRFDEHLGFRHETTIRGAGRGGCDVLIYVMRNEDCRFIG